MPKPDKKATCAQPRGEVLRLEFNLAAGIVDFTNPAAKAWWKAKLIDLLHKGVAVFKADFGDRIPEDAQFFNGRSGKEMITSTCIIDVETRLRSGDARSTARA